MKTVVILERTVKRKLKAFTNNDITSKTISNCWRKLFANRVWWWSYKKS